MLNAASWAHPATYLAAAVGICLILSRTGMSDKGWERVDFVWILSSAVTLYFLATGMLYDQARTKGQLDMETLRFACAARAGPRRSEPGDILRGSDPCQGGAMVDRRVTEAHQAEMGGGN